MSSLVKDWGTLGVYLISDDGIATYMKTVGDQNYALLLGATDQRSSFDANPLLRITPGVASAR